MRWFNQQPEPQPEPLVAKYTIERLEELLTRFGQWRLQVADPNAKVVISQITWGVLPYVSAEGDPPSGSVIADAMTTIEMLIETLDNYVKIQDNPAAYEANGGAASLLQRGHQALNAYWQKISASRTSVQSVTTYNALTTHLSGNRAGQGFDL